MNSDNPVILTNRGVTHASSGNVDKAEQDFDRAIALNPDYVSPHLKKAWLEIDRDQPEAALANIKLAERIGPLDVYRLKVRSRAHLERADWQSAAGDAGRALAMGSPDDWPYEYRARAKRGLGDYEGAVADASVLATRDPDNINRLVAYAIPLHLAGQTAAALTEMNQAISRNVDPAFAYEIKSYINRGSGRLKEAVSDAQQSLTAASGDQLVYSNATLGWALLEDRQPAAAIDACSSGNSTDLRRLFLPGHGLSGSRQPRCGTG